MTWPGRWSARSTSSFASSGRSWSTSLRRMIAGAASRRSASRSGVSGEFQREREPMTRQGYPLVVDGQLMGFAKGVVAEGRFAFLSGVTGTGPGMGEQAESVWNTIKERVEALGGRVENVVQRMTFVTSVE